MKLSRERFELELAKIKASVPPTHVGPRQFTDYDGSRCIISQVLANLGATFVTGTPLMYSGQDPSMPTCLPDYTDVSAVLADMKLAMKQNDYGMTWHAIIDDYFHRRTTQEGPPALEPRYMTAAQFLSSAKITWVSLPIDIWKSTPDTELFPVKKSFLSPLHW